MGIFNIIKNKEKGNEVDEMNNYKRKRLNAKLDWYTVAKGIGLTKEQYNAVENGELHLEGDKLDRFNSIIENANLFKLDRKQKLIDIKEYAKGGKLKKDMKKLGYTGLQLSDKLGINNGELSRAINLKGTYSDTTLEMVYDFLTNSINKNISPKKYSKRITTKTNVKNSEEDTKNQRIRDLMKEFNITGVDVSLGMGKSPTYVSKIVNSNDKYIHSRDAVLQYITDNYVNKNNVVVETNEEPGLFNEELLESPVVEENTELETIEETEETTEPVECSGETLQTTMLQLKIKQYENTIVNQQKDIDKLKLQISRYEKLIDLIKVGE